LVSFFPSNAGSWDSFQQQRPCCLSDQLLGINSNATQSFKKTDVLQPQVSSLYQTCSVNVPPKPTLCLLKGVRMLFWNIFVRVCAPALSFSNRVLRASCRGKRHLPAICAWRSPLTAVDPSFSPELTPLSAAHAL
jgi:hypothetical protein